MSEQISTDRRVQQEYEQMLRQGVAPRLAEMLALQSPPTCRTDTRFLAGEWGSARYSSQLARFPGDPEAYVSSRADVLRLAKARGMAVEGTGFSYTPPGYHDPPEEQPYEVADDIVEAAVRDIADEHPEALHDPELRPKLKKQFSGDDGSGVSLSGD